MLATSAQASVDTTMLEASWCVCDVVLDEVLAQQRDLSEYQHHVFDVDQTIALVQTQDEDYAHTLVSVQKMS